jgi:hypothetical protein
MAMFGGMQSTEGKGRERKNQSRHPAGNEYPPRRPGPCNWKPEPWTRYLGTCSMHARVFSVWCLLPLPYLGDKDAL